MPGFLADSIHLVQYAKNHVCKDAIKFISYVLLTTVSIRRIFGFVSR